MPFTATKKLEEHAFTGRFYDKRTQTIVREVEGKNGKMRAPTLRDLRDLDYLVPSVTTVLKEVGGYDFLTAQAAIEKYIEAQRDTGRNPSESEIMSLAHASCVDSSEAQEFGTRVHNMIEEYFRNPFLNPGPGLKPYQKHFWNFLGEVDLLPEHVEKAFVRPIWHYGKLWVGGTVDFIGTAIGGKRIILDWKTQSFSKKPTFHNKWPVQMAPYDLMCGEHIDEYWSVIIPSREPSPFILKRWTELDKYRQIFVNYLHNWYLQYGK